MKQTNFFKSLFMLAVLLLIGTKTSAQEPYAVLSDDNTTLTFYYDDQKTSRSGMGIGPFDYNHGEIKSGWYNQRKKIINVVFDDSFANCHSITSTACWFYDCENLTTITGIQNLNTEYVTDMNRMFGHCYSLTALDLSGFVTDRVTDMSRMFTHCKALTSLNFSNFNTANVTDMQYMFDGCLSLTNLDVTKFNTEKVIDMSGTFSGLSSLSCLDLSNLNTTNVTRMKEMFGGCTSLTILDLSNFNTANVTDMSHMFRDCQNLETLNLSGFNTSNVTNMKYMFNNCPSLKTIYASDEWSNEKVTNSELMFYGCENIVGGAGTTYNLSKIDHTYAHIDGGAENPGYFTDKAASGIKVKLSKTKAVIEKGKTLTLKAKVYPTTEDQTVTWKSSDKKVATVTSAGKVKGVGAGTATITCTSKATGAKATCKVTVGYVKLNYTELTVEKGKIVTLKSKVYPSTVKDQSVTWESSDPTIVKVTSSGKIKGMKVGKATITCTSNATGLKATCEVTVGYVKLNYTELTVEKGKIVTLKSKVYPTTEDQSVTWESSDPTIVKVASTGKIKGLKTGTAIITCTSNATGLSATCKVTVVKASAAPSLDDVTGIEEKSALAEEFDVYDLNGRRVLDKATSLEGLSNGVYIVNGKKVVKK